MTQARIPLLNASGCLDALVAPEVARQLDTFVTKTVTPLPREGNPPPRIAETDHGMLNSIGLQNPGIDVFVRDYLPRLKALGVPLWVSVGGFSAGDYALVCERLDDHEHVGAIELNLSCPNVEEAPETAAELVSAARAATSKALYAKLSPATSDIAESARSVAAAGADGLSLVNTIRGLALDTSSLRPVLAHPERYEPVWADIEALDPLLDVGAVMLLDVAALAGKYGRTARKTAEALLDAGYYQAACSDAHKPSDVADVAKGIRELQKRVGEEETKFLLTEGPRQILEGRVS